MLQVCLRRHDDGTNMCALFSLAVRSAQIIGIHEDPGGKYPPFEAELRRRLWFHVVGLESRTAEDSAALSKSIMQNRSVKLPLNLNDYDLQLGATQPPKSRIAVTDMTFCLLRFEIHSLVYGLWNIRNKNITTWTTQSSTATGIREEQMAFFEETQARLQSQYLSYMDASRPNDYMCLTFIRGMLVNTAATPLHLILLTSRRRKHN